MRAKCRFYSACVSSVTLYGIKTWLVKEENIDYQRMIQGWFNGCATLGLRPEGLRTRTRLKSTRECLRNRRLQWFGHLKTMEECFSV